MAQAIKYESTSIDPTQSAMEIADLVRKYGGSRFQMIWDEQSRLEGIRFAIRAEEVGEVPVRLMAQTGTIEDILRDAHPYTSRTRRSREQWEKDHREQAYRIAWRQLKDFVEQALLAVETGLFPIASAFMAHVEVWDDEHGETVTMGELVGRRAVLEGDERGIRLLPGRTGG